MRPEPLPAPEAGRRFAAALDAAGLSRSEAARRLGVPQPRVSEWCTGRHVMTWARLLTVARTLGLDPAILAPEWFA